MNAQQQIAGFLAEIGSGLGINLPLNEDGRCVLLCEAELECEIRVATDSQQVLFSAQVSATDSDTVVGLTAFALDLNFDLAVTRGATLTRHPRDRRLYLQLIRQVAELDSNAFANLLGGFITTAQQMQTRLDDFTRHGDTTLTADQNPLPANDLPLWQQIRV